jgi:cyclohexanone monooxygenase
LEQEWEWTERYATQPEILRYVDHVASRFDLRRDVEFSTRVTAAAWDEGSNRWLVKTDRGHRVRAQFLIMAVGCLSAAKLPELAGIERFAGDMYHTGRWPHEGVDFTGRSVGVIGTGSSGIQSIPIIAEQAAHLTVFQRTPNFSVPAKNAPLDPTFVEGRKASYRQHRKMMFSSRAGIVIRANDQPALSVTEEERHKRYWEAWEAGNLFGMASSFGDIAIDRQANETAAEFVRERIRSIVDDPDVAEALSPRSYPFATKRLCLDSNYYATFNRDNVVLVDVRADPIVEVTSHGLRTAAADFEFDALVFATGFDAMTGPFLEPDIRGAAGRSLRDKWAAGPRSYLGVATAGFPNLFTITGPGSPSVLTNMLVSIEQHVDWVTDCIDNMRSNGAIAIDPEVEAEDFWVSHVNDVAHLTLFPQADSWYMGANVPGKPRVFMPYLGGFALYREICDGVASDGYRGFALTLAD